MGVEEPHRWRFHGDLRARVRAGDRDHDVVQGIRAPGAYDRRAAFVCAERGQLGQRYAIFGKYEEKRWNPLAAVGTLLLAAVMYAGASYVFPDFPRGWVGVVIVLGRHLGQRSIRLRRNDQAGFYYYRARYYSPTWGRFISEDPLLGGGFFPLAPALARLSVQALNAYAYGFDDPMSNADPEGENPISTAKDFWRKYRNMQKANTIGADKHFHCMANCEGSREAFLSRSSAEAIGEGRQLRDQYIKGYPKWDCDEDRAANWQGLLGDRSRPCKDVCGNLRPPGLPPQY